MVSPIIALKILGLEIGQVNEDGDSAHKLRFHSKSPAWGFERFYEKVIKVKADVAALLNLFSDASHRRPMVTCGAVKGAAEGRHSS
jgi:hypothetical protein